MWSMFVWLPRIMVCALSAVKVVVLASSPDVGSSAYDLTIIGGAKKQSVAFSPPRSICNGMLPVLQAVELVSYAPSTPSLYHWQPECSGFKLCSSLAT
jgi:hypothetical protein